MTFGIRLTKKQASKLSKRWGVPQTKVREIVDDLVNNITIETQFSGDAVFEVTAGYHGETRVPLAVETITGVKQSEYGAKTYNPGDDSAAGHGRKRRYEWKAQQVYFPEAYDWWWNGRARGDDYYEGWKMPGGVIYRDP